MAREPVSVVAWGIGTGVLYAWLAKRLDKRVQGRAAQRARDFFVLGWYALAATAFVAAFQASLAWRDVEDIPLHATLKLAVTLSFVLALASMIAAGAYFTASARVKPPPSPRRSA